MALHGGGLPGLSESPRIELRNLGRWLLPGKQGRDCFRRDRREQNPVAVVATGDQEALPLADQGTVIRSAGAQARRRLDDLQVGDGGDCSDRLAQEQFGGVVGRCVVVPGILGLAVVAIVIGKQFVDVGLFAEGVTVVGRVGERALSQLEGGSPASARRGAAPGPARRAALRFRRR